MPEIARSYRTLQSSSSEQKDCLFAYVIIFLCWPNICHSVHFSLLIRIQKIIKKEKKQFFGIQSHWQRKQQKTYNLIQSNEHCSKNDKWLFFFIQNSYCPKSWFYSSLFPFHLQYIHPASSSYHQIRYSTYHIP